MENVVVRLSPKKIVKNYLLILLVSTPFLGAAYAIRNDYRYGNSYLWLLGIVILFCAIAFVDFVIQINKSQKKSVIELNHEGVKIFDDFYFWRELYEFKVLHINEIEESPRYGKQSIPRIYLVANSKRYDLENELINFSTEEIYDIIRMYKQKIGLEKDGK